MILTWIVKYLRYGFTKKN